MPAHTPEPDHSTRMRLLQVLRRTPSTVAELAEFAGITDNGVRAGLAVLERDGLVTRSGIRRSSGAGKPPHLYAATDRANQLMSQAYIPALLAVATAARARLPTGELLALFQAAGRQLATTLDLPPSADAVAAASSVLESLGAVVSTDRTGPSPVVSGAACPLAVVVRECAETCELVRALLATTTGAHVVMECEHGDAPRCHFALR
jgi:predicted ArsR family transcriptional regulator